MLSHPSKSENYLGMYNSSGRNRSVKLNGFKCVDGSTHRGYIPREYGSFPTIYLEVIVATLVMDAYEVRCLAIFDVPVAYFNAYIPDDKDVKIKLEGEFVGIICDVNPDQIPNIQYENGKKVIYLSILKALYGCIELDLLWCELYVDTVRPCSAK